MKFKVKDRVAFYRGSSRRTGEVIKADREMLHVKDDTCAAIYLVHEKQCRRLVKKAPQSVDCWMPEPFFISPNANLCWRICHTLNEARDRSDHLTKFIHVRVTKIKE